MDGELEILTQKRSFNIKIIPSTGNGGTKRPIPLSSLSGGEKSKTLSCLINTFWKIQPGPFKGLDEWDVFLDEKSRKVVEQMLVNSAKKHVKGQVFFISPQQSMYNTKTLDDTQMQLDLETENVKVIKIEK